MLNERYAAFAFAEGRQAPFTALDNADFIAWIEKVKKFAFDRNMGVRANHLGELVIHDHVLFTSACWEIG